MALSGGVLVAKSVERIRPEVLATLFNQRLVAVLVTLELWNMILSLLINEDICNLRTGNL
jgi:hypothetical protein